MPYETLRDLDEAGLDLRVHCYGCGRQVDMWSGMWAEMERRGWSIRLTDLAPRFRCKLDRHDGTRHDLLLIPCRRPPPRSWESEVAAHFHEVRARGKRRK